MLSISREAVLRLLILLDGPENELPPLLSPFRGGVQVDLIGESNARGVITLFGCACENYRTSQHAPDGNVSIELTFRPTSIWVGPRSLDLDDDFNRLRLGFRGIHGVIGTKPIARKRIRSADDKSIVASLLGDADDVFYVNPSSKYYGISMADPSIEIRFGSGYSRSASWTEGETISTYDECCISSRGAVHATELISVGAKVERFLSFICLVTIRSVDFDLEVFASEEGPPERFQRVWCLAARESSEGLMFHEALSSWRCEEAHMETALRNWLSRSEDEALARWLYLDVQDQNVISVGRFISVCQAVEIVGRRAMGAAPFDKDRFRLASQRAAEVICEALGEEFQTLHYKNRFRGLVSSGNRHSFRDHLYAFASEIPASIKRVLLPDEDLFITKLVRMRNLLIHMDDGAITFDQAERELGEMIFRLLALFAVHQGVSLGLDPSRVLSGLQNSSIGRSALHYLHRARQTSAN